MSFGIATERRHSLSGDFLTSGVCETTLHELRQRVGDVRKSLWISHLRLDTEIAKGA